MAILQHTTNGWTVNDINCQAPNCGEQEVENWDAAATKMGPPNGKRLAETEDTFNVGVVPVCTDETNKRFGHSRITQNEDYISLDVAKAGDGVLVGPILRLGTVSDETAILEDDKILFQALTSGETYLDVKGIPISKLPFPRIVAEVHLENQTEDIAPTDILPGVPDGFPDGLYRITVNHRAVYNDGAPGGTGQLFTTLGFDSDNKMSASCLPAADIPLADSVCYSGLAIESGTTMQYLKWSDCNDNLTYSTTISGKTGTPMYNLDIIVEKMF